jgi:hypothetical protein
LLIVGVVLLGEAGPAAAHAMHDDSLQSWSLARHYPDVKIDILLFRARAGAGEIIQSGYTRKLGTERSGFAKTLSNTTRFLSI